MDFDIRNGYIHEYFFKGYKYKEMRACLLALHNIDISVRQIKRILKEMNLRRRDPPDDNLIRNLIQRELDVGTSCNLGYRSMQSKLLIRYQVYASRERIRKLMKDVDPEGVLTRSRRRLKRRKYINKGPNFTWHLDGYDKLKPYGFCIHGCIDGYSRKILWLRVGYTNNDPAVVLSYFLDCISELKGIPQRIRSDRGTENGRIAAVQRYFREKFDDPYSGEKSFVFGRSTSNQRIEAWWSKLRIYSSQFWINFFKDMIDDGTLDTSNVLAVECLRFCFTRIIQNELDVAKEIHNNHIIRPYASQECPNGRPNIIYNFPYAYDGEDYLYNIDDQEIDLAREFETKVNQYGCSNEFCEIVNIILDDDIPNPSTHQEGYELFVNLMEMINDIEDI